MTSAFYLPDAMPKPVPSPDGLDAPYWEGTRRGALMVQRCEDCGSWQWGPEWLCHRCLSFKMGWEEVERYGVLYSWARPHHPVHPALRNHGPYVIVLVELPHAGNVRMIGNLVGPVDQAVHIGASLEAVFEAHDDTAPPFTLVQWRVAG